MTRTARCSADGWWSSARDSPMSSPPRPSARRLRAALCAAWCAARSTQRVPIVFAPEVARSLIGSVFEAASATPSGAALRFLAGKLGEPSPRPLTIVDDNACCCPPRRRLRHLALDGEGLPRGAPSWSKAAYCKLPAQHYTRASSASSPHQRLARARRNPASATATFTSSRARSRRRDHRGHQHRLLRHQPHGFRRQRGHRRLLSRTTGLWIENGQLTHAVEEVTVAGTWPTCSRRDSHWQRSRLPGSVASATLRIDGMTSQAPKTCWRRSVNHDGIGRGDNSNSEHRMPDR